MNVRTGIVLAFAAVLTVTPLAGFSPGDGGGGGHQAQGPARVGRGTRDFDRDRVKAADQTYERDRDRDQDRRHVPDFGYMKNRDIYGNELMTNKQRKAHRQELAAAGNGEERARTEAEHRKEMQTRAEKRSVAIEPPARDIYAGAMMSVEERNAYREQLRLIGPDREERTRFMADHEEKIQNRAKAQGVVLADEVQVEEAE